MVFIHVFESTFWGFVFTKVVYVSLRVPIFAKLEKMCEIRENAHETQPAISNRNTRTRCEICSKLKIKIPERRHWHCSGIFIVNFEHISHLVLVFLLLTLNM